MASVLPVIAGERCQVSRLADDHETVLSLLLLRIATIVKMMMMMLLLMMTMMLVMMMIWLQM